MTPIIAIVGLSGSGKTRVATALIGALSARGYRVAAVKHCHHGHQIDLPEKDSALLLAAGAVSVTASSPGQVTTVERVEGDPELERLAASLGGGHDLVLAEGFKRSSVPKVLVEGPEPIAPPVEGVIAVVSEQGEPADGAPAFTFQALDALAALIEQRFLRGDGGPAVSLVVDGAPVGLAPFAGRVFDGAVRGLVSSLKGVPPNPKEIRLIIGRAPTGEGPGEGR
jgi:molybdopterin-guanine dinucleotide biosynthesis protein MobB